MSERQLLELSEQISVSKRQYNNCLDELCIGQQKLDIAEAIIRKCIVKERLQSILKTYKKSMNGNSNKYYKTEALTEFFNHKITKANIDEIDEIILDIIGKYIKAVQKDN